MWDLLAKDFPLFDERAPSTDGEKEVLRDSGTFPCSNKTPGGWKGSWNLLKTALGYQHASWGRRKNTGLGLGALKSAPWCLRCPSLAGSSQCCHFSSLSLSFPECQMTISGQKGSSRRGLFSLHRSQSGVVADRPLSQLPSPCPSQLCPHCPRPARDEPLTPVFLHLAHLTPNPPEGAS